MVFVLIEIEKKFKITFTFQFKYSKLIMKSNSANIEILPEHILPSYKEGRDKA